MSFLTSNLGIAFDFSDFSLYLVMSTTRLQAAKNTPSKSTGLARALEDAENTLSSISKSSAARSLPVTSNVPERPVQREPATKKRRNENPESGQSSSSSSSSDSDSDAALGDDTFYRVIIF